MCAAVGAHKFSKKKLTLLEHARVHLGVRLDDGVAERRVTLRHKRGKNIISAGSSVILLLSRRVRRRRAPLWEKWTGPTPDSQMSNSQFPIPNAQKGFRV